MEKRRNIKREIKAIKKIFKNNRHSLSRSEINEIRTDLYKKQLIYDFLRTKTNLNDDERRVFKRIPKYLQKSTLIYQSGVTTKKIIYMVKIDYLMKTYITNLLR